jgi:phenylpyruvate tautomerase PptA (4-oxalocrotonate tautomerase family)
MPHITIKHFPSRISDDDKLEISKAMTNIISKKLKCPANVISISMIEIEEEDWNEKVYIPEISQMHTSLIKKPAY